MLKKEISLPSLSDSSLSGLSAAQIVEVRKSEIRSNLLGQVTIEKGLGPPLKAYKAKIKRLCFENCLIALDK